MRGLRLALLLLGPLSMAAGAAPPKRLVVVTHTTGFRHSSIPTAERVLSELGASSGLFTVTLCRTDEDVKRMLIPSFLASVDAVFFANTTGDLGIPDLPAFLAWVRSGHAFLGAHSAGDTYHPTPETGTGYVDLLGAEFLTHGTFATVEARTEDRTHPSVASLPASFPILDEIYEFVSNPRPRVHVVLALDRHPDDGHPEAGLPGDFPLSWYSRHGDGAVWYTALGHREEVWESPVFQSHLVGGLRWALAITDRTQLTIPASASRPGLNGTLFRSNLSLFNRSYTAPVTASLRLLRPEGPGSPRTLTLGPRETRILEDVVGSFLLSPGSSGAIEISWPASGGPISATSRVFTSASGGGTNGAAVSSLSASAARTRSLFVGLSSNGGDLSAGYRTNAGVSNQTAGDVTVKFELVDGSGARLGTRNVAVPAGSTVQVDDVFRAVGASATAIPAASLVVTSPVPVLSYVTTVDNLSGDSVVLEGSEDEAPR